MGLSYYFAFAAPATTPAAMLRDFLCKVENEAKKLGFSPTLVLDADFDTAERQNFARRLAVGMPFENEKLKGVALLRAGQVWSHDPSSGSCRLIPKHGVVLVVTNDQACETVFGFFQFPSSLKGLNGKDIVKTGAGKRWTFRSFVDGSDPRYRQIVKKFTEAGYTEFEKDEFK